MTSVNGYSNYSQTGMYIPSYMQTPGTTTTTTNTTTTTTSEKKDGVGMGTVLLAGAAILGGIITFKNGGLKNTFKQIGKLFGKNADDAAKNLNLLEKGKALLKGTNPNKGTDAVGEALSAAAGKTEKAKWSETLGDMYKSIKNKFTTKSNTDDIAQEAAKRTANEQAAKEFAEQSQKEYFGRVDQTTGKSAQESAAVFEAAERKANKQAAKAAAEQSQKEYFGIVDQTTGKSAQESAAVFEAAERTANEQAAKEFAEQSQKKYFGIVDQTTGKSAQESADVFKANDAKVSLQHNKADAKEAIAKYGKDSVEGKEAARDLARIEELENAQKSADKIAQEAAERTANEQAAKAAAEQSQKEYFGRVDQTTGKSAKESAAVFEEAAEKAKVSLQQRKTEAEATIAQYGKDSIEGKEAARDLVKIENELKNYTTTSQPTNIQEILDEIAQEEQIADLRQAGR
ncbi:MAG TPA: hypothetical protein H9673_07380 [Candidatus Adamsella sp.]|nr:hypothetical protein [Candidatus Adamsella sp.]